MEITPTSLPDVMVVEPRLFSDDRGWFMEVYNTKSLGEELRRFGCADPVTFVQENHSCSAKSVLRGLHYQIHPEAQGKLVRVVRGVVFDVAVDLQRSSPTFGQWIGIELSAENMRQLWIPPGYAHGFLAMKDDTQLIYNCTRSYSPECESTIAWNDLDLAIRWPLPAGELPKLSQKDANARPFRDARFT